MQNCPSSPARPTPFAAFDVVVIAASLGGPETLSSVLSNLLPDFPAAVLVVQHMTAGRGAWLTERLARSSSLPVAFATGGEAVQPGAVYVAAPDRHLLVGPDRRLIVDGGPKVKFCRPAAEPLFASAAGCYRERALGVILTGCNTDGSIGVQSIKWMGGRVLVQDPATCRAAGMPLAAIRTGAVDFVLPLDKISAALIALVMVPGMASYLRVSHRAA